MTAGESRPLRAELDAAGIGGPELRAAYARARALNAEHGRTYFLATRLLSPGQRPAIHALYGFARLVDDVVDVPDAGPAAVTARVGALRERMDRALSGPAAEPGGAPPAEVPASGAGAVIAAMADTARRYGLDRSLFTDFMDSMVMDLSVTEYATFAELARYVHGSAAVIGLQVLPVLGVRGPWADAEDAAAALGVAFQLTNFLRDVGEDLDRGRIYLPTAELAAFGVDRDRLEHGRRTGHTDVRVRRALAYLVARTRAIYRRAEAGIGLLAPGSRPCVRTAATLYGGILDEIVAADYDVLGRRVAVGTGRRVAVAGPRLAQAVALRSAGPAGAQPARTPWPARGA